ncbi:hypothetical protein C8J57DRAFT_1730743 [Mycena rebaudengoi]|nr:hypothetical protein C8J57DRAFT_1730743 [Mycena rebaudengoi]
MNDPHSNLENTLASETTGTKITRKLRPTSVASGTYILKELRLCNDALRITSHSRLTSTAAHGISFPQPTTPPPTPASPDKLPQWSSRRRAVPPHPIEHLLRPTPSSVLVQATYNPSSTSYPTTGDSAVHPGKQHDHVRPRRLLADAAIRNDAAIHDAGRDAAHADGEDLYFYTLVPSPVSSASTSSGSATSESYSASEESTSESDSEGEEEGDDAQAYTERITDFAMRHTPAAADFAQPRACTSLRPRRPPRDHPAAPRCSAPTITPSTTPAAATRAPGPWSRRKGCAGCASSLPRRSPNPPRMRTGRSSSRSQYGCVGGGGYQGAAQQAGVYQGGGQQQQWTPSMQCTTQQHQQQAHQQQHTAPTAYAATHWTPPHPAYALAGHGQWTPPRLPRFADLERWSPRVREVVPSHAPQVPSHGLAPPAHTHIPSYTLP